MLARQRRLLILKTQIAQLEEELIALEECAGFHDDDQDEAHVSKKRRQEFLTKTLEELLSRPIDSCTTAQGSRPTITTRRSANSSQDLSPLNSRFANFNLGESSCQTTVSAREQTKLAHQFASQADIRATIPLGEQVSPLDDVTNNNDRWSASDISFRGSTPVSSESHDDDHSPGPTQMPVRPTGQYIVSTHMSHLPREMVEGTSSTSELLAVTSGLD